MNWLLSLPLLLLPFLGWSATEKDSSEWLLIYYLPYDNNLSEHADTIISQLGVAKDLENVNVVLQVDRADSSGMERIRIVEGQVIREQIYDELSTSRKSFQEYLLWVDEQFEFEKSALFLLDHGGSPDEIGQDLTPDSTFLITTDIRKAVLKFNRKQKQPLELIYLQMCSRGSIEILYEFRDLTKFILASQHNVGAPNYYYEKTLQTLNDSSQVSGSKLASWITKFESPEMFSSLTCLDMIMFPSVRNSFISYLIELEKRDNLAFTSLPETITYAGDRYWDLISFLDVVNTTSSDELSAREALKSNVEQGLIVFHTKSPNAKIQTNGISMANLSKQRIGDYWHMKFYRDFKIRKLDLQ